MYACIAYQRQSSVGELQPSAGRARVVRGSLGGKRRKTAVMPFAEVLTLRHRIGPACYCTISALSVSSSASGMKRKIFCTSALLVDGSLLGMDAKPHSLDLLTHVARLLTVTLCSNKH